MKKSKQKAIKKVVNELNIKEKLELYEEKKNIMAKTRKY